MTVIGFNQEGTDARFPTLVVASISHNGSADQELFGDVVGRTAVSALIQACLSEGSDYGGSQFVALDSELPSGSEFLGYSKRIQAHIVRTARVCQEHELRSPAYPWKGPYGMWFMWMGNEDIVRAESDRISRSIDLVVDMLEQGDSGEVSFLNPNIPICLGVCGWDNPVFCGAWIDPHIREPIVERVKAALPDVEVRLVDHEWIARLFETDAI